MGKNKNNNRSFTSRVVRTIGVGLAVAILSKKIIREMRRVSMRNKVVLITGGSRGLGLAIAREMAAKGASLVLCARTASQLEEAAFELEQYGVRVLPVVTDLRDPLQVAQLFQYAMAEFGRIDILINNAGVMMVGPENVMDIEDYKSVMEANVWSSLHTVKEALPIFRQQGCGHIVNICSIGGKFAVPHMLPYSVSKFAMVGLSPGLAAELARERINVTTVIPNLMRTGSPRNITLKGDHKAEYGWFKLADSWPLISQDPDQAARCIVNGIETRRSEIVLTLSGKFVNAMQGLCPGTMTTVAKAMNLFLPKSANTYYAKGWEAETAVTQGSLSSASDEAAEKYNQY